MSSPRPLPPRLRSGRLVARRGTETVVFTLSGAAADAIDDADGAWCTLLGLLDGARDDEELARLMTAGGFALGAAETAAAVDQLVEQGVVLRGPLVDDAWLNQRSFLDLLAAPDVSGDELQERVRAAAVTIIGVGGVGSWTALAAARLGFGRLVLVDPDLVEERNLPRQAFSRADLGRPKVEAVRDAARAVVPTIEVATVRERVESAEDAARHAAGATAVVCGADGPTPQIAALRVIRGCVLAGVPCVTPGYAGPSAAIGPTWLPGRGVPCPVCLEATPVQRAASGYALERAELSVFAASGQPAAVTVVEAQLCGALAAAELLRIAIGEEPAALGRIVAVDTMSFGVYVEAAVLNSSCPACS